MVREAGATEVHVRISCPPIISPCYYGIDTPTREELIAAGPSRIRPLMTESEVADMPRSMSSEQRAIEEIRRFLGADSVGYLSLESLRVAVGDRDEKFCTSCYTGNYPTELVQLETAAHRDG
jgi:amidophosphoribosyltransferase